MSRSSNRRFSSRRRRFEHYREGIKGEMIRAPGRPFAWWEPFNGLDAIGRTLVLTGLWFLSLGAVSIAVETNKGAILPDGILVDHPGIYLLTVAAVFFACGAGMLIRSDWSIPLLIYMVSFIIPLLPLLMYQLFKTSGRYASMFTTFSILTGVIIVICTSGYLREPCVEYEFRFVHYRRLSACRKESRDITGLLAVVLVMGTSYFVLMQLAMCDTFFKSKHILYRVTFPFGFFIPGYLVLELVRCLTYGLYGGLPRSEGFEFPWDRQISIIMAGQEVEKNSGNVIMDEPKDLKKNINAS